MAVALADSGTRFVDSTGSFVTSRSLTTFTVSSGSNRCLFAVLSTGDGVAISGLSMTWNGAALTEVTRVTNSRSSMMFLYRLTNPDTGNNTLAASWTGSCSAVLGAMAFTDVNQSAPIVVWHTSRTKGTSTAPSVTVASSVGDATLAVAFASNNSGTPSFTTPRGQTLLFTDSPSADVVTEASYALDGSSNSHTFTLTASIAWGAIGVHIQSATGPQVAWLKG